MRINHNVISECSIYCSIGGANIFYFQDIPNSKYDKRISVVSHMGCHTSIIDNLSIEFVIERIKRIIKQSMAPNLTGYITHNIKKQVLQNILDNK